MHGREREKFVFILKCIFFSSSCSDSYHLDGFVVGDCIAIEKIMTTHHYTSTIPETIAVALHAGADLDCGDFYSKNSQAALDNKTIVEADIDRAVIRLFDVQVRLGYFDPPEQQPYRKLSAIDVDTAESRQLALEAAQQSLVLLKNINKALPLDMNQLRNKKIALIGPSANATTLMQGNYFGSAPYLINPIKGFENVTQGNI